MKIRRFLRMLGSFFRRVPEGDETLMIERLHRMRDHVEDLIERRGGLSGPVDPEDEVFSLLIDGLIKAEETLVEERRR